jgi:linoleoyl-CoA desaturase
MAQHITNPKDQEMYMQMLKAIDSYSNLTKKDYWFLLLKFFFFLSVFSSIWIGIITINSTFLFILLCILFGIWGIIMALNFGHDFSHDTVFKSKRLNKIGFIFQFAILGAHADAWKIRHTEAHHLAPNVGGLDTDLNMVEWIRLIPDSKLKPYHKLQPFYLVGVYSLYSLFWIFIKDPLYTISKIKENGTKSIGLLFSMIYQKLFYFSIILILPIIYSQQPLSIVLLGFICMHVFQSLFLSLTFMATHHVIGANYPTINSEGKVELSWMRNQIECSNDFHPFSPIANFIFGGFNNHIAHHLFPHIHHFHYVKVNKIIYPLLKEYGFRPLSNSYFGSVKSHFQLLAHRGSNLN